MRRRRRVRKAGVTNTEFRLGTIEELPVADASVDVAMSNCVVNLSPEKPRVFREAFRVIKPGGRLLVSDIVLGAPLPERVMASIEAYVECVAGAALKRDYLDAIAAAGFSDVCVVKETSAANLLVGAVPSDPLVAAVLSVVGDADELRCLAANVMSIAVSARKAA